MRLSKSTTAGPFLVTTAIALLAVSCGSGSGGDGASDPGSGGSSVVSLSSFSGTDVLADAEGHSLYSTEAEKGGQIRCVDACTSFWEPVIGSGGDARAANKTVGGGFAVVDRPDGRSQLTYHGLPLYTFAEESADELQGDGFTDDFQGTHFVWDAARAPGASAAPSHQSQTPDSGGGYGY